MGLTGVFPVNSIRFKVGTNGVDSTQGEMAIVKDMETFGISFDNGVEEWKPIDQEGWARRLMTAKSVTVSISGKRHYGDPGNDYIAGLAYENGQNAATTLEILFPDGGSLVMKCIVNVSASDGGDATAVSSLEFECLSDGKPVYTKAGLGA